jgi:hypothetical protein
MSLPEHHPIATTLSSSSSHTTPSAPVESEPSSTADRIVLARKLASHLEAMLARPPMSADAQELFRYRLARAHALGIIDQLDEMLAFRPSSGNS